MERHIFMSDCEAKNFEEFHGSLAVLKPNIRYGCVRAETYINSSFTKRLQLVSLIF